MSEPTTVDDPWQKVVDATEGHNLASIDVCLDEGFSWTYIRCTCGNQPDGESFTEAWQFTDHIRRLVFAAVSS
jgi:hypothetical protein